MTERTPGSGWTDLDRRVHVYPLRVFYEDTDALGIVYHANYLKFAERARTEMLRLLGTGQWALMENEGVGFSVRHCEVEFIAPARLDDVLEVHTSLLALAGASLRIVQTIRRGDSDITRLILKIACVSDKGRAARLPENLRDVFEPLLQVQ